MRNIVPYQLCKHIYFIPIVYLGFCKIIRIIFFHGIYYLIHTEYPTYRLKFIQFSKLGMQDKLYRIYKSAG